MILKHEEENLRDLALIALKRAYAPYSGFAVAAVIETVTGEVFHGVNVENVAYPEGTCAEAGAIAHMVGQIGATAIQRAYVVARSSKPVPPCGGCRQKLREFCIEGAQITMATVDGDSQTMTIEQLLPGAFMPSHMDQTTPQATEVASSSGSVNSDAVNKAKGSLRAD